MITDPISNLIISLKNAAKVGKPLVTVPFSNTKLAIAEVLEQNGFISAIGKKGKKVKRSLELALVYVNGEAKIHDVKRVSKPSRRIYKSYKELYPIKQGFGLEILSTPQGIMTAKEAKKAKVGGESLFIVW